MRFIKEVLPYIVILLVVILIRTYIITPVIVNGESMSPTLKNNELLLLKKYDTNTTQKKWDEKKLFIHKKI